MGPSGAGKTSLLNVLAGYINRGINGTVMLNDKRMQSRDMRKISAYIMQDDRHAVLSNLKTNPETFFKFNRSFFELYNCINSQLH